MNPGDATVSTPPETIPYEDHIGVTRQYWRDIILGVNDGLVSMLLLVAGVVGGGLDTAQVLLTGVAGAIAGAVSMAAGEYLATKSQDEILAAELALERDHITHHRPMEVEQLREMFADMGVTGSRLDDAVTIFSQDDQILLNAMKSLEFGVVESERRSPYLAMVWSGLLFLLGSSTSVVPFLLVDDVILGLAIASAATAIGLFAVGVIKSTVSRAPRIPAGLENLLIAGFGGVIAWSVGRLVGTALG